MTGTEYEKNINDFFRLYNTFLFVDSIASITEIGRNRKIINTFLKYFTAIVDEQNISQYKDDLKKELKNYIRNNQKFTNNCDFPKEYITSKITQHLNNELNNSYKQFIQAAQIYYKHRKNLSNEEIVEIYKRNAIDYHSTSFGSENIEQTTKDLNKYIASKKVKQITMLKQSLMEFNNAISHINSAMKKQSIEKNLERAEQHFNRGALDFYKSIIKELFLLNKITDADFKDLRTMRCNEFNTIGATKYVTRQTLYSNYIDFCKKHIN